MRNEHKLILPKFEEYGTWFTVTISQETAMSTLSYDHKFIKLGNLN